LLFDRKIREARLSFFGFVPPKVPGESTILIIAAAKFFKNVA
jgi:hypothetical protein